MTENNDGFGGAVLFAAGTLLGAFLVYLVFRGREQKPASAPSVQHPYAMQPIMIPPPVPQMPDTHTVQDPAAPSPEQGVVQALNLLNRYHTLPYHAVPSPEPEAVQVLQNEETWELKKDKRGRLEKITVHRKVTRNGQ